MTPIVALTAVFLAAGALAFGGPLDGGGAARAPRVGVLVDAPAARHGRELLDPRLRALDADVRVPRTAQEARVDARYLAATGVDILVAVGPRAADAAQDTGLPVRRADGVAQAAALLHR